MNSARFRSFPCPPISMLALMVFFSLSSNIISASTDSEAWIFEKTGESIETSTGYENGMSYKTYEDCLAKDLKKLSTVQTENVSFAFRISKKDKKSKIIGIFSKDKHLEFCDNQGKKIAIKRRKDLTKKEKDLEDVNYIRCFCNIMMDMSSNECTLSLHWANFNEKDQYLQVSYDKQDKMTIKKYKKSPIPSNTKEFNELGQAYKDAMEIHSGKSEMMEILLDLTAEEIMEEQRKKAKLKTLGLALGLALGVAYALYKRGYFSQKQEIRQSASLYKIKGSFRTFFRSLLDPISASTFYRSSFSLLCNEPLLSHSIDEFI